MTAVTLRNRRIWLGDEPHALLSGEVHFWRLDPLRWRDVLCQVRALGLDQIASYVCWDYHQTGPGTFDFTGQTAPQRNLTGFLDEVAAQGLHLLIRPGPYIYSEWANGGLPADAARLHRLHPDYRAMASEYIAAVCEAIRPYLATRGGPIWLVQAENEPDPWPHIYEAQLGLGSTPGPFHDFLRARYAGDLDALNAAWETVYTAFEQARAVTAPGLEARGYQNRYLDFVRFRHWYTAEVMRWTAAQFRAGGIDVPLLANVYTTNGIQNWRELESICDVAGPDAYPTAGFRAPDEHRTFLHTLVYTRAYSALPCIPELQAGIWDGGQVAAGAITPSHYTLTALSALMAGVVGWNWYMLVSRDNWLMSPVSELGHTRPNLYAAFAEIVRLFRAVDPPSLERLASTAVTVDPLHQTARLPDRGGDVLRALYDADITLDAVDVETGEQTAPLLFYVGGSWLSAAGQDRLFDTVRGGGTLVLFQEQPRQDDALRPLSRFDLPLPAAILGAAAPQRLAIRLGDRAVSLSSPAFFVYDDVPGEPITAERIADEIPTGDELAVHVSLPVGLTYTVGWRQGIGAGQIVVLGVQPSPELVAALHAWLEVPIPCRTRTEHVHTALFRRGESFVLIAANLGDEARHAVVDLDRARFAPGPWAVRDLRTDEVSVTHIRLSGAVTLHLPPRDGTILTLEPA
jgi:hypothetical protein